MKKEIKEYLKAFVLYASILLGLFYLNNPFVESKEPAKSSVAFVYQQF